MVFTQRQYDPGLPIHLSRFPDHPMTPVDLSGTLVCNSWEELDKTVRRYLAGSEQSKDRQTKDGTCPPFLLM
jgi:hypothetical protein